MRKNLLFIFFAAAFLIFSDVGYAQIELANRVVPNGRLAFTYRRGETVDIYQIDFETSTVSLLYGSPKLDEYPTWSPDGTRIVFYSDQSGDREIYSVKFDGSNLVQLTKSPGDDEDPDWSPDGTQIVFHSARVGTGQNLFVMNADGSKPRGLTSNRYKNTVPRWSPRGNEILFSTTSSWPGWDLGLIDVNTKATSVLTNGFKTFCRGAWHPSGGAFVFSYGFSDEIDLYIQEKGGQSKQLTSTPGREYDATFTDDGKKIFFVHELTPGQGDFQLYLLNLENNETTQVTKGDGSVRFPTYTPLPRPPVQKPL